MTHQWQTQAYQPYQPYQSFNAPASGPVSAIFQPGFAGTDVQEVRALNAGYATPALSGGLGVSHAPIASAPSPVGYQPHVGIGGPISSIYSPGFVGTDVQEVRARNLGTYAPYAGVGGAGVSQIFSPGFAGTNPQEVRGLQPGYPAPATVPSPPAASFVSQGAPYAGQAAGIPGSVNAIFHPGFAGTNVQEVRALNTGYGTPYRSF
ncbi:hypothetical protein G3578_06755 [Brevibacillus sp. SYP-B805]|uniref:hypothetical protein n=1 Tax=Brevibacillus sp. SYP-B805 TaxID=1578199 RepID=UPI0013ED723E|nr:hypothetical protein [Brevibacillus sp. SYP-B805]NGQ94883.1 hypothetical protein [Brevibacillus sp. SYP-B805]